MVGEEWIYVYTNGYIRKVMIIMQFVVHVILFISRNPRWCTRHGMRYVHQDCAEMPQTSCAGASRRSDAIH